MKTPWVSREAYDLALSQLAHAQQEIARLTAVYDVAATPEAVLHAAAPDPIADRKVFNRPKPAA